MVDEKDTLPSFVVLLVVMVTFAPSVTAPVNVTLLLATSRVVTLPDSVIVLPVTARLVIGVMPPIAPDINISPFTPAFSVRAWAPLMVDVNVISSVARAPLVDTCMAPVAKVVAPVTVTEPAVVEERLPFNVVVPV